MADAGYLPSKVAPPKPMREFRGVWVATVGNIDWPSQKGLPTAEQKSELIAILDKASALKLNVVVFQVRPACDALYASRIEPWSEYLTGTMGQAPAPIYDPLAFAVEEAHKRGLELHAWFNPYRAHHTSAKSPIARGHISITHPSLVRQYGKSLWLDPGEREVQDYSLSVVMDVVNRYDVDGVHFDDYFYPYKEKNAAGAEMDFPDDASWQHYGARGKLGRDDWRRGNVDQFIQRVYESIKTAKPHVKFGVSPFGIWKPKNPPQIEGFDAYSNLYADSRKWIEKGWVDYLAPQLYWSIKAPQQSFPVLLRWWTSQNPKGRQIVAGMDTTKTRGKWPDAEILNQIRLTREIKNVSGHIHWNMKSLLRNDTLSMELGRQLYSQPVLMPLSPWLGKKQLPKPTLDFQPSNGKWVLNWSLPGANHASQWLLQTKTAGSWATRIFPGNATSLTIETPPPEIVSLSAVDRLANCSAPVTLQKK